MKTLLVGDMHLKMTLILPLVEDKVKELDCQQVILLGDYMDERGQQDNSRLYAQELQYLLNWKHKMVTKGIKVISLIGNHDAPYLIEMPASYSCSNIDLFWAINESLLELGVQIAYKLDDFIVSHAGYALGYEPQDWHFKEFKNENINDLTNLAGQVGKLRGGQKNLGSPIWADFLELSLFPNPDYLKQIVGHTPQEQISHRLPIINIDTFSLSSSKEFLGNGDLLLYNSSKKELAVVPTDWKSSLDKISNHFYKNNK
ncbi:metallophosphoesterase [Streptococcaceae bacterium ESL0729]|nr:metallophosphoesterase [Streptococcaceae bacterium ESL0729]